MRFTATLPDNISFAPGSPARQARTWGTKAEGPHSAARNHSSDGDERCRPGDELRISPSPNFQHITEEVADQELKRRKIHAAAEIVTIALTAIGQIRSATSQNDISRRNTPRIITRIWVSGLTMASG